MWYRWSTAWWSPLCLHRPQLPRLHRPAVHQEKTQVEESKGGGKTGKAEAA
ncbi:hypothetical protein M9458_025738, partial [Cirrhinus mrigala]